VLVLLVADKVLQNQEMAARTKVTLLVKAFALECRVVWLKYCVASSSLSMIIAEQSTEAFSPYHATRLITHYSLRDDKPVVEPLMIG